MKLSQTTTLCEVLNALLEEVGFLKTSYLKHSTVPW